MLGQRDQVGDWPVGIRRLPSLKGQGRPAADQKTDVVSRPRRQETAVYQETTAEMVEGRRPSSAMGQRPCVIICTRKTV